MPTEIQLAFDDDNHQAAAMAHIRARLASLPDGELVEDAEGVRLVLDAEDEMAALVRAQVLVTGALDGTDIEPSSVRRSAAGWPV